MPKGPMLSEKKENDVVRRLQNGESANDLAEEFGCSRPTIYNIRKRVRKRRAAAGGETLTEGPARKLGALTKAMEILAASTPTTGPVNGGANEMTALESAALLQLSDAMFTIANAVHTVVNRIAAERASRVTRA